jgi:hypothetical protein
MQAQQQALQRMEKQMRVIQAMPAMELMIKAPGSQEANEVKSFFRRMGLDAEKELTQAQEKASKRLTEILKKQKDEQEKLRPLQQAEMQEAQKAPQTVTVTKKVNPEEITRESPKWQKAIQKEPSLVGGEHGDLFNAWKQNLKPEDLTESVAVDVSSLNRAASQIQKVVPKEQILSIQVENASEGKVKSLAKSLGLTTEQVKNTVKYSDALNEKLEGTSEEYTKIASLARKRGVTETQLLTQMELQENALRGQTTLSRDVERAQRGNELRKIHFAGRESRVSGMTQGWRGGLTGIARSMQEKQTAIINAQLSKADKAKLLQKEGYKVQTDEKTGQVTYQASVKKQAGYIASRALGGDWQGLLSDAASGKLEDMFGKNTLVDEQEENSGEDFERNMEKALGVFFEKKGTNEQVPEVPTPVEEAAEGLSLEGTEPEGEGQVSTPEKPSVAKVITGEAKGPSSGTLSKAEKSIEGLGKAAGEAEKAQKMASISEGLMAEDTALAGEGVEAAGAGMEAAGAGAAGGLSAVAAAAGPLALVIMGVIAIFKVFQAAVDHMAEEYKMVKVGTGGVSGFMGDKNVQNLDLKESMQTFRRNLVTGGGGMQAFAYLRTDKLKALEAAQAAGMSANRQVQDINAASFKEPDAETYNATAKYLLTAATNAELLGKDLKEAGAEVAEMHESLALSFDTIQLFFLNITRQASNAGIANGKFIALTRQLSQEQENYGSQLKSTAKILENLGRSGAYTSETIKKAFESLQPNENQSVEQSAAMLSLAGPETMKKAAQDQAKEVARQQAEYDKLKAKADNGTISQDEQTEMVQRQNALVGAKALQRSLENSDYVGTAEKLKKYGSMETKQTVAQGMTEAVPAGNEKYLQMMKDNNEGKTAYTQEELKAEKAKGGQLIRSKIGEVVGVNMEENSENQMNQAVGVAQHALFNGQKFKEGDLQNGKLGDTQEKLLTNLGLMGKKIGNYDFTTSEKAAQSLKSMSATQFEALANQHGRGVTKEGLERGIDTSKLEALTKDESSDIQSLRDSMARSRQRSMTLQEKMQTAVEEGFTEANTWLENIFGGIVEDTKKQERIKRETEERRAKKKHEDAAKEAGEDAQKLGQDLDSMKKELQTLKDKKDKTAEDTARIATLNREIPVHEKLKQEKEAEVEVQTKLAKKAEERGSEAKGHVWYDPRGLFMNTKHEEQADVDQSRTKWQRVGSAAKAYGKLAGSVLMLGATPWLLKGTATDLKSAVKGNDKAVTGGTDEEDKDKVRAKAREAKESAEALWKLKSGHGQDALNELKSHGLVAENSQDTKAYGTLYTAGKTPVTEENLNKLREDMARKGYTAEDIATAVEAAKSASALGVKQENGSTTIINNVTVQGNATVPTDKNGTTPSGTSTGNTPNSR